MSGTAKDLRAWIEQLRAAGELVEVTAPVDPHLEITEIAQRTVRGDGPALLFTNVRGSDMPILINQFGSDKRIAMAFGAEDLEQVAARIGDIIELQPPAGIGGKIRALGTLKSIAQSPPKIVRSGSCQDVVMTGDDASLDALPILTCWPLDAGPYITLPMVFTKNPVDGKRNCGMYRMQKFDAKRAGMHWQIHKDGAEDWRAFDAKAGGGDKLEVAVAIGCDPISTYSATAPLPKPIDEMMFAGFMRGDSVDIVRCKTVDVEVPAHAEIVLEGYVKRGELATEGPFGDHTGYYSLAEEYPVFHLTAVTHRKDPIYSTTVVGVPPQEDCWLGKATERIFLPLVKTTIPEIVDYDLPWEGVFHNCVIVSIEKRYPLHAHKVMHAIWGTGLLALTKCVIVVDANVDVHDYRAVAFRAFANADPGRDVVLSTGPLDVLDHSPNLLGAGGKIGIDATTKNAAEGYTRQWPPDIEMAEDVVHSVTARWQEFGIDLTGATPAGARN